MIYQFPRDLRRLFSRECLLLGITVIITVPEQLYCLWSSLKRSAEGCDFEKAILPLTTVGHTLFLSSLLAAMMGLFSQAGSTFGRVVKPRGSLEGAENDKAPSDTEPDDTSILSVPCLGPCSPAILTTISGTRMKAPSLHR